VTYTYSLENMRTAHPEVEPLMRQHYAEMTDRLANAGHAVSPYNPRWDAYFAANDGGDLLHFVIRHDGKAVGYSGVYIAKDMHNQDLIAQEDTIYVTPEHRNGCGRKLTQHIMAALQKGGVKRAYMTAATDPRAAKLWQRMGFKLTAQQLTYFFEAPNVRT
jgi:ribosomal protein S18 acetylase RimI-like enzyme